MWWLWVPVIVLGSVTLLFAVLVVLGRFRNGALLRPVIARLSRIGFMRRLFTRLATAGLERQNPELASAMRKLETVATNTNPQAVQKAMSRLTPAERRAYMEMASEQMPAESSNRQMRRQAERMQQQARGGRPGSGGGSSSRKRKRR